MNTETTTFNGLGIAPKLMEILDNQGFKSPTPIQRQSIPAAISGKDLIGIAQTGTGKTLAFGIPMLQRLIITKSKGLVLLPTRELAVQVNDALKQIGKPLGLKTAVIIGGESMYRQIMALKQNPHIIIATPGRLIDILGEKKISLAQTGVLVLDEADRMLDMGFAPQLKRILPHLPKERQTMLFSATMDQQVTNMAAAFLELPVRIEVAPAGTTASQVTQEIIMVNRDSKTEQLKKTLTEYKGSTLVFCRTKHGAKKIAEMIRRSGMTAAEIHSNRSLNQRFEALEGFKIGKYRVLVATDIAARGIDVNNIELVINYDLPQQAADYVHRIGRTARAGKAGHAISFATADQSSDIRDIERLIKKSLPISKTTVAGRPADFSGDRGEREFSGNARRSFGGGGSRRFSHGRRENASGDDRGPRREFGGPRGGESHSGGMRRGFGGTTASRGGFGRKRNNSRGGFSQRFKTRPGTPKDRPIDF